MRRASSDWTGPLGPHKQTHPLASLQLEIGVAFFPASCCLVQISYLADQIHFEISVPLGAELIRRAEIEEEGVRRVAGVNHVLEDGSGLSGQQLNVRVIK